MSIYHDACFELSTRLLGEHETEEFAYNSYITGLELHELAVAERARFDPEHPKRFRGSQKAWDELVWKIAKDAWQDARDCAKIKPIELARSTE